MHAKISGCNPYVSEAMFLKAFTHVDAVKVKGNGTNGESERKRDKWGE